MRSVGQISISIALAATVYLQAETPCLAFPVLERFPSPIPFDPSVLTSTAVEEFGWVVADQPSTTSYAPDIERP